MGRRDLTVERKENIIKAFYEVAKKKGLENASIAKVAEELGISNGLVLHYFKNKEEMLCGLNSFILEQHINVVYSYNNVIINNKEKLIDFVSVLFSRTWNDHLDDGVFYSFYALIYRDKKISKSFNNYLETLHNVFLNKLKEAKKQHVIHNENLEELTKIIFALIDGAYYYLGTFDEKSTRYKNQLTIYINHCIRLFDFNE